VGLLVLGCVAFGFWHAAHTKLAQNTGYVPSTPDVAFYSASRMASPASGKVIGVKHGASIYEAIAAVKPNAGSTPLAVLSDLCHVNGYSISTKAGNGTEIRWTGTSPYGCKVILRYDKAKKTIECRFVDVAGQP
jgi:hypothetical protein